MTTVLTSIHGKKLGIDSDGYLTGDLTGIKTKRVWLGADGSEFDNGVITTATVTSTGTEITNHGFTTFTTTAAKAYTIADPTHVGQRKVISKTSSSTAAGQTVTTAGSIGFDGLNHILTLLQRGDAIHLQATSTAAWAVISKSGSLTLTTA